MEYYFIENESVKGPVSKRSMVSIIEYGDLTEESLVRYMSEEWSRIGDTEFKDKLSSPKTKKMEIGKGVIKLSKNEDELRTDFRQFLKRPRSFLRALIDARGLKKQVEVWVKYYGVFDVKDYSSYSVEGLDNETGYYAGDLIAWAKECSPVKKPKILFAGESTDNADVVAPYFNASEYWSTGIIGCDIEWDFNDHAPTNLPVADVIVSQSMIEHILSPMQHLEALVNSLNPEGILLVSTCMPRFTYHRYPHDTLRYHPDWFEAFADKFGLTVVRRRIVGFFISYCFKKEM
ncbi:hypothetical protein [Desulfovibrio sp. UCD-KL4C]|uniref:hypothetical protein n=1 Tax=Desulfovibrio sp. UCD-KL4C TaxID=2578120 RepID=UPI0025BDAC8F|nr:hypothetical protein [Desulfovibrio sp. UCD-KL4C]